MIIDAVSGEIISRRHAEQPQAGDGQEVLPEPVNPGAIWVAAARAWNLDGSRETQLAYDLALMRAAVWERIKAARDRAEWWGCAAPLGRVDTNRESQRKVSGAVQLAMIAQAAGAPFEIAWTMQDNATAAHDAPAMIAMGVAVGTHVAACHAVALAKRAAVEAAADAAAIAAIDIEGGWPDAQAAS